MNILAVGAHWDDIELGCGLTLKRLREKGHTIFCVVVCSSRYGNESGGMEEGDALVCGLRAFRLIGAEYVPTNKEPNQSLVYGSKIMQMLEGVATTNNIDAVFTHWFGDVNTDHRAVWEISRTAFRNVKNFLMYQSNSYGDGVSGFQPNLFFGFNKKQHAWKEKLLSQYALEWKRRKKRWGREVFDKERYWGYVSGSEYAEGFQVGRIVDFFI